MSYHTIIIHDMRRPWPQQLLDVFPDADVITDTPEQRHGAGCMHLRALQIASSLLEPTLILEDDAIPTSLSSVMVERWTSRQARTGDPLVSYYLGRGAPRAGQSQIEKLVKYARERGLQALRLDELRHGVAYSVTPGFASQAALALDLTTVEETEIYRKIGDLVDEVIYTMPSVFDHDDTMPSLVNHRGRRPPQGARRAWWLPKTGVIA